VNCARILSALALGLLGALGLAAPAAASPAPAWRLSAVPLGTNFPPGSHQEYFIVATDIGAGPTSGEPIVLKATLPAGVAPTGAFGGDNDPDSADPTCSFVGQAISCESAGPLHPSRNLEVLVQVEVASVEPQLLSATASIAGGGATEVTTLVPTRISPEVASFGLIPGPSGLSALLTDSDGSPATQAGSHPDQQTVNLAFPTENQGLPTSAGHLRDAVTDLPRGLLVDPAATPVLCTEAELESVGNPGCPDASQVGVFNLMTIAGGVNYSSDPLYNMVPPRGTPAEVGFNADNGAGIFVHLTGRVRSDGDFGLSADINDVVALTNNPVLAAQVQFWGDPSSESHDQIRGKCGNLGGSCPVESQSTALLTMPTRCTGPIATTLNVDSWEEPGVFHERSAESTDLGGNPVGVDGCNHLQFEPTISSQPSTNLAESPAGLDFNLHQPQNLELEGLSTAALKDVTVTLPQGMTLNPAAADGIAGCAGAQIGMLTAVGESPVHLSKEPSSCPDASKIGTVEATTPALAEYDSENKIELDPETGKPIPAPLKGSIYLAKPFDNPFDSLLAVYLALEDEKTGIIAKVPGKISADPSTGQLVTRFAENPELPLEDVRTHFFAGSRAPLITPPLCGAHTTSAALTPWSSPEGADVTATDSLAINAFPGGGSCPTSAGAAPNSPSFSAGTIAPVAGAYSPLVIKLLRQDGSQRLNGVDATLPPGLIGKLAGLTQCSEARIAAAKAREAPNMGAAELSHPSCPASSQLGAVDVSAGAGPTPLHVGAKAYMAGPYKGAPISLAIITPAVAGPFDLGTVVTRIALYVNSQSAQIHAISDPIPTILGGIPLDVRGASLKFDRPSFTLNPTSCDPMAILANATAITGQLAPLRSPFQVGGCSALGFKPKLALSLQGGGTKRGGHPAFNATYTPRAGDANAKGLVVRLPRSAFLDQAHIRTICTRVQFAASACPAAARYGFVKAWTPLLEDPLEGPVWLRSSNHKLPDLVFDLRGQIDVEVATRIDSVNGGIRARIESAPDAPLTKVILHMQGQKKGLIVNSRDICQGANRADVELEGQNGKVSDSKPQLKAKCGKSRKGHGHRHGKHGHKAG
jgi:hypothetical protein